MEADKIVTYSFSTRGKREMQQDFYYVEHNEHYLLCIICDGMGGMEAGNEISKLVGTKLAEDIRNYDRENNLHAFFAEELIRLDDMVFQLTDNQGLRIRGGTTVAACVIFENRLYWFSVGDSRIYCMRKGKCHQITVDHNYGVHLQGMKENGEISTVEYIRKQIDAEKLTSYVGMGAADLFDSNYRPLELKTGDRLLLCTDGIYRTLSNIELETILREKHPVMMLGRKILYEINKKEIKNQDNATGIILEVL